MADLILTTFEPVCPVAWRARRSATGNLRISLRQTVGRVRHRRNPPQPDIERGVSR
jgi:hypothetical protein